MKVFLTAAIAGIFSVQSLRAQEASATSTESQDSSKLSIFTIGLSYGNTANYYGQTTAEKLPYGSADISYRSKTGLWAAASAIKLINTGSGLSELDLSAGYDFDITRHLAGSLSYSRYFFEENSPLIQSINPNAVSAGVSYDWNWFNSTLYGDYLFGPIQTDFFLTMGHSKLINLGSLFSRSDYLTVEPSIYLMAGTLVAYEAQTTEQGSGGGIRGRIRKRVQDLPLPGNGSQGNRTTTYVETSQFNLLTTAFKIPLAYNRPHYSLEGSYQLSLPNNSSGLDAKSQSFFTVGFYYLFY